MFLLVVFDGSGVPAVVDLAAMRECVARLGGDPAIINPVVPVDLVIDHSVQVDVAGSYAMKRKLPTPLPPRPLSSLSSRLPPLSSSRKSPFRTR